MTCRQPQIGRAAVTSTAPGGIPQVTIGVDNHKDTHVAHAVDHLGRPLGTHTMRTTSGYRGFVTWATSLGELHTVGIEGVGHYGAGLARHLRSVGVAVREVGRPNRQRRARYGKPGRRRRCGNDAGRRRPR
jgi:transposase